MDDLDSLRLALAAAEHNRLVDNRELIAQRDRWIRLFNQLERHVSRHYEQKQGGAFCDDADDVLHKGWRQVLKAVAEQDPAKAGRTPTG